MHFDDFSLYGWGHKHLHYILQLSHVNLCLFPCFRFFATWLHRPYSKRDNLLAALFTYEKYCIWAASIIPDKLHQCCHNSPLLASQSSQAVAGALFSRSNRQHAARPMEPCLGSFHTKKRTESVTLTFTYVPVACRPVNVCCRTVQESPKLAVVALYCDFYEQTSHRMFCTRFFIEYLRIQWRVLNDVQFCG
jgi:hypothetical protein